MNKQVRTFLAGVLVVVPFAVTLWVIYSLATWLGSIGYRLLAKTPVAEGGKMGTLGSLAKDHGMETALAIAGAVLVFVVIYFVGLLMSSIMFRRVIQSIENMIRWVPGVKTIYESVRDLLKLFGSGSGKMGKVVLYRPNGGEMAMLGILTNENPSGLATLAEHQLVAVYLPMAYMLGGPIVYVPRKYLTELDIPVEHALKLCATAEISPNAPAAKIMSGLQEKVNN